MPDLGRADVADFPQIPKKFTEDGPPWKRHPRLCPPDEFSYDYFLSRAAVALAHDVRGNPILGARKAELAELCDRYLTERMFADAEFEWEADALNSRSALALVAELVACGLSKVGAESEDRRRLADLTATCFIGDRHLQMQMERMTRMFYESPIYTVPKLRAVCRDMGLKGCSRNHRAELIDKIMEAESLRETKDGEHSTGD